MTKRRKKGLVVGFRPVRHLLLQTIHVIALRLDHEQAGRKASPGADVLDSWTVGAPHAPGGGFDGAKRTRGRKQHIAHPARWTRAGGG